MQAAPFFVATAIALGSAAAIAAPGNPGAAGRDAAAATTTSKPVPTDFSAQRRRYRYVGNRWRVVRPYRRYSYYGYYGPRPYYYRPYPLFVPFPFGLGFGFNPYYW